MMDYAAQMLGMLAHRSTARNNVVSETISPDPYLLDFRTHSRLFLRVPSSTCGYL